MVENWRAKRITSFSLTGGCRKETFANKSLGFRLIFEGVMRKRLRLVLTVSGFGASISPF